MGLSFLVEPQDVVASRGQALHLDCAAESHPNDLPEGAAITPSNNVTIEWLKDGVKINDARRSVLQNGSLYFQKVIFSRKQEDRNDEGVYECIAKNSVGAIRSRKARLSLASK